MNLEIVLPLATAWAEAQQADILATGTPLSQEQLVIAQEVGVARPDNIRIKLVERLPLPQDPVLISAALETELFADDKIGMALFYGIFVCHHANGSRNLIAHECRHVRQYEQKGSIAAFLEDYLLQIVTVGYENTSFEQDATLAAREYTSLDNRIR